MKTMPLVHTKRCRRYLKCQMPRMTTSIMPRVADGWPQRSATARAPSPNEKLAASPKRNLSRFHDGSSAAGWCVCAVSSRGAPNAGRSVGINHGEYADNHISCPRRCMILLMTGRSLHYEDTVREQLRHVKGILTIKMLMRGRTHQRNSFISRNESEIRLLI